MDIFLWTGSCLTIRDVFAFLDFFFQLLRFSRSRLNFLLKLHWYESSIFIAYIVRCASSAEMQTLEISTHPALLVRLNSAAARYLGWKTRMNSKLESNSNLLREFFIFHNILNCQRIKFLGIFENKKKSSVRKICENNFLFLSLQYINKYLWWSLLTVEVIRIFSLWKQFSRF